MQKKVLIVGCGNLGLHLSGALIADGYSVTAARRSVSKLPSHLPSFAMDVTDPETFADFEAQSWDAIIVTLTARGEEAYRKVYVEGMRNILASLARMQRRPLVLFTSSTSVYHQDDGSVVNEQSATKPEGYSGKTMLEAEASLLAAELPSAAVRFSGIYGSYRIANPVMVESNADRGGHLLKVLNEGRICPPAPMRFSNRIHINDCVGVLHFLVSRFFSGIDLSPVYLASDGNPVPLHEVMTWIANVNNIATDNLVEDYRPNRGGNKRCIGTLLTEQGYEWIVPDYRQGYSE